MAKPKGSPKTGGRQVGTPNKRRSIVEICEELELKDGDGNITHKGFDPFIALAMIASDKSHDRQFDALKELCQYIEPKKKQTEHAFDPEKSTIRIIVEDYSKK